jgi:CarboxypepD_reg-like domain/TonB-dependent Receptor Plug Domain
MNRYIFKIIKYFLICVLIPLGSISAFSQNPINGILNYDLKISERYTNTTVENVLLDLKVKYKAKIYYQKEKLPLSRSDYNWTNANLTTVLQELIVRSDLEVIIYRETSYVLIPKSEEVKVIDNIKEQIEKDNILAKNKGSVLKINGTNTTKPKGILSGKIVDEETKDEIIGAPVLINGKLICTTDEKGAFQLTLGKGVNLIEVTYLGYADYSRLIDINGDVNFSIRMVKDAQLLDEVTISSVASDAVVKENQIGVNRLDIRSLEKLPTFLGERDVVKAILLNPGVASIGEGSSGFNVRGGSVDQNLILQDEAILFNSSHALGFFSTFNADMIKSAALSKGNISAAYGGRLASVLDVTTKDGSDRLKYKVSMNPIAGSGSIEAPLGKNSQIIAAVRSTFSDFIFGLFSQPELKNSSASFYDLNAKYMYKHKKSVVTISGYLSKDDFNYNQKFGFDYGTKILQASWKKLLNDNTTNKLSLVWSDYYSNQFDYDGQKASVFSTNIKYLKAHDKFTAKYKNVLIESGVSSIFYITSPGELNPLRDTSAVVSQKLEKERGVESAVYISTEFKIAPWLEVVTGFRLNHFAAIGPKNIFVYEDGFINESNIIDTLQMNGILKSYLNPELRLSAKITISNSASLKIGYSKTSQYINQIFNTDTPAPSSQWQLSNQLLSPGQANNFSAGFFQNLNNNNWELSIEAYYRDILHTYDYKDFAKLIVNPHIETELLAGSGRSKGLELSIKKNKGKFNGFLSYTWSQALLKVEGINDGNWYRSNFDKPHNLSLILNYQPIERRTFTANFSYSTGRPTTPPISNYTTPDNIYVPIYADRNQLRIPDTHRLDLAANFGRSHNRAAKIKTSWTFTLYNVYGRKNPFSIFYTRGFRNVPQANRLAVIGTVFPSLSFNIEFI